MRSRNCIFISLTSGSIFGFSSPAAAVASLTSEQPNLGQPLTPRHWWPSPVLQGGVCHDEGFFGGRGGGGVLCVLTHRLPPPIQAGSPLSKAQSSLGARIQSSRHLWNSNDFHNDEIDLGCHKFIYCQKSTMRSPPPPLLWPLRVSPPPPSLSALSPDSHFPLAERINSPQFRTTVGVGSPPQTGSHYNQEKEWRILASIFRFTHNQ